MKFQNKTVKRIKTLFPFLRKKANINNALEKLQTTLKYRFNNQYLLKHALTHKSFVNPEDKKGLLSNERLEFLGDSILNCLVTEHIYNLYPDYSEGQLSKIKSLLVSRKIIGEVAKDLKLGNCMIMGKSEKKSGGQERLSILSNAFEALIGAVYIDKGFNEVRKLLHFSLFEKLEHFISCESNVNYKSKILELSQGDGLGVPTYPLIACEGPDHAKKFTVGIEIAGIRLGVGSGYCKKDAQQNAAYRAINKYSKELILSRLREV
jgi:ribonuclease-3